MHLQASEFILVQDNKGHFYPLAFLKISKFTKGCKNNTSVFSSLLSLIYIVMVWSVLYPMTLEVFFPEFEIFRKKPIANLHQTLEFFPIGSLPFWPRIKGMPVYFHSNIHIRVITMFCKSPASRSCARALHSPPSCFFSF